MKKKLLSILLLITLFSVSSIAQKTTIGLRIGLNAAKFLIPKDYLDEDLQDLVLFVPTLSIPVDIPFSNHFSFQPEINLLQKGAKIKYEEEDYYEKNTAKILYIETPLLLKYSRELSPKVKVGVNLGPSFGYALSGESNYIINDDGDIEKGGEKMNFDDEEISRYDIALNVGTNLLYKIGRGNLVFDLRYQHGLTKLIRDEDFSVKNQGLQFSAGYVIPLSNKGE